MGWIPLDLLGVGYCDLCVWLTGMGWIPLDLLGVGYCDLCV